MKIIPGSKRHRFVAIISIVLVAVALVVGMVSWLSAPSYDLTIASTTGGSVTTPGEAGPYTYDKGTVVNLTAEREESYRFVEWTGNVDNIDNVNAAITVITMHDNYSVTANFGVNSTPMVAAGGEHTVGLKSDGTVVAMGYNNDGQCNVGGWTDIVQVAAGGKHTVGLKADGTVVAVGDNAYGQCNVGSWADITQVCAGGWAFEGHTVGLTSDGTVIAVGHNGAGECNVGGWTGITQVTASYRLTVGLKADCTVVAQGRKK